MRRPASGGIDQRRSLAIDGRGLAVRVGGIVIGIQNLNFITAIDVHAVIAAALSIALDLGWRGPFEVKLKIAKLIFRADASGARGLHVAIFEFPLHVAFLALPLGKIFSVEEHHGVRRRGRLVTERRAGCDDLRDRPAGIVYVPLAVRLQGRVGIAVSGRGGEREHCGQREDGQCAETFARYHQKIA